MKGAWVLVAPRKGLPSTYEGYQNERSISDSAISVCKKALKMLNSRKLREVELEILSDPFYKVRPDWPHYVILRKKGNKLVINVDSRIGQRFLGKDCNFTLEDVKEIIRRTIKAWKVRKKLLRKYYKILAKHDAIEEEGEKKCLIFEKEDIQVDLPPKEPPLTYEAFKREQRAVKEAIEGCKKLMKLAKVIKELNSKKIGLFDELDLILSDWGGISYHSNWRCFDPLAGHYRWYFFQVNWNLNPSAFHEGPSTESRIDGLIEAIKSLEDLWRQREKQLSEWWEKLERGGWVSSEGSRKRTIFESLEVRLPGEVPKGGKELREELTFTVEMMIDHCKRIERILEAIKALGLEEITKIFVGTTERQEESLRVRLDERPTRIAIYVGRKVVKKFLGPDKERLTIEDVEKCLRGLEEGWERRKNELEKLFQELLSCFEKWNLVIEFEDGEKWPLFRIGVSEVWALVRLNLECDLSSEEEMEIIKDELEKCKLLLSVLDKILKQNLLKEVEVEITKDPDNDISLECSWNAEEKEKIKFKFKVNRIFAEELLGNTEEIAVFDLKSMIEHLKEEWQERKSKFEEVVALGRES